MRKRNAKGNCNVQTLAIEIITPLNECTEILSRVCTGHKQNRRGMQKKVREKSSGKCHNHKPQPFPSQTPRGRGNRQTKQEQIEQTYKKALKLPLSSPSEVIAMLKRTEKQHKNKINQGKTSNKSPRRVNPKTTKSKTNTGTNALERSVE